MNTISTSMTGRGHSSGWSFWGITFFLAAGLILSILSWLEICVEHCSANQDYRLLGLPFAFVGMGFFSLLIVFHVLSRHYPFLSLMTSWMIASALGSELMFIAVQKYQIGHWCPVCLSIAASVALAAFILAVGYIQSFRETLQHKNPGETMKKIKQGFACLSFAVMGFLMAFVGISKPDFAAAAMNDIKDHIAFGLRNSPVEVYIVTDWYCPSCRKIEPEIEKMYPKLKAKATVYFIDYPIHKKSLNFTPYNLSFLVNNKPQYFKARTLLSELADKTENPNDEDVEKIAHKGGLKFKELPYLDVKSGIEYFDKIVNQYNLNSTPTIIITNPSRKAIVKYEGRDEISESKVLDAVDKLTPAH